MSLAGFPPIGAGGRLVKAFADRHHPQHPCLQGIYTRTLQEVSEMVAFADLKVAGGDLLEGAGMNLP